MPVVTDSGKIKLSKEEYDQLRAASKERDALRVKMNTWQGLLQSAMGNVNKVTKELQEALREMVEAEVEIKL